MAPNRNSRRYTSAVPATLLLLLGAAALFAGQASAAKHHGQPGGGGGGGKLKLGPAKCLCIMDNDRTLTGKQGWGMAASGGNNKCPADIDVGGGAYDKAYGGGPLTLSELGQQIQYTWCGANCYLGIISAGDSPTGKEAIQIGKQLSSDFGNVKMPQAKDLRWADAQTSNLAPFLYNADSKNKFKSVPKVINYYKQTAGVTIADKDVFFFDDIAANVASWKNTQYNAHQVSCLSRDKELGLCGATVNDINQLKYKSGCSTCNGPC